MEDLQTDRLGFSNPDTLNKKELEKMREPITDELRRQVPPYYEIKVLPFFLNFTDSEKIKAVVQKRAQDFLLVSAHQFQQFAVGVKLYPF